MHKFQNKFATRNIIENSEQFVLNYNIAIYLKSLFTFIGSVRLGIMWQILQASCSERCRKIICTDSHNEIVLSEDGSMRTTKCKR